MTWFADYAMLPEGLAANVLIDITDGRFSAIRTGAAPGTARRLPGIVLPGFANSHSHAFHRALRGRTHDGGGTFWTWRDRMYAVARRLDPDNYLVLARATYAEMALAGVTAVAEFHYVHHAPGGARYNDPNAMAEALRQAASDAGIRLTLLDTCYLAGGLGPDGHRPLNDVQRRFSDGDVAAWQSRAAALTPSSAMRLGVAIHSVRAVPRDALAVVAQAADLRPLHVHLSEQPAENVACLAYYECTPTELLHREEVLGPHTTAVHATHLSLSDIVTLGRTRTTACFCPTTERDLADGIGPAQPLREAGSALSLGSDQNAVIDLIEEARALEMHERLDTLERGRFTPSQLLEPLTNHAGIGWTDAGRIEVGQRADLVAIRLDSIRTAGGAPDQVLMSASASDVDTVLVDGRAIVEGGQHMLGDVGSMLADAITPFWPSR
jgi:formiminoglutamate deiminase